MIKSYFLSNSNKHASKWVVLIIDTLIVAFSFFASYVIRFNLTLNFDLEKLFMQLPIIMVVSTFSFVVTGSYKGFVRHTGIKDVYNIFNAISLASIITIFTVLINKQLNMMQGFTIPLSIIIIHSFIGFFSLTAARYVFKTFSESLTRNLKKSKNVLIYGAGESGIIAYNAINSHTASNIKVIAYIDDDKKKVGKTINGIRVVGGDEISLRFLNKNSVSEIIVAIHNIGANQLRHLVESLVDFPVEVKIVPPVQDWINGEFKVSQIKNVQIEDLLNRVPIQIKQSKVAKELSNKTIMVTGGAGSIGSEIIRQIVAYDYRTLIIIDQAESALYELQQELKQNGFHNFVPIVADIRDKNRMNAFFSDFKPEILFHAAAYKHVPLMECNSYEAIKINIAGTKTIADLSIAHKVEKFVFVSTDKAVNPTNVMGATKRIAEMYISCMQQESRTKFITTRFGNVLGSNGSVIPLFKKQIEKGGPLTVTHKEITRYFMTIPEASQLVLEAGAMGQGGEIFIFDMGESVKIYDLAKNMIKLSGLKYPDDIDIKITGLRPGEKLYEELLANGENTLPTYHSKILISKVRDLEYSKVKTQIDELVVSNMFFNENTIKLMKDIVPEYISKNSELCKFDDSKEIDEIVSKDKILQS